MKRGLSGIFYRVKMGNKYENMCFEDMDEEYQDALLVKMEKEQLRNLVKLLANTIKRLGDDLDISIQS